MKKLSTKRTPPPAIDLPLASLDDLLEPIVKKLKPKVESFDPKTVLAGTLADYLYGLRTQRSALGGGALAALQELLGQLAKKIEDEFVSSLEVGESSGVQGFVGRVQITDSIVPTIEDPEALFAHIKKTGEFDLLNRQLNREAVRSRWDDKKRIPGVGKFVAKKVSCTKLSGKATRGKK